MSDNNHDDGPEDSPSGSRSVVRQSADGERNGLLVQIRSPDPSEGGEASPLKHLLEQAIEEGRVEAQQQCTFVGPLPPPEILMGYSDAAPNGAERIIANWEAEGTHRRRLGSGLITSSRR